MGQKVKKYPSSSTANLEHDLPNLLVESILINKYNILPAFSWRKDQPLQKEWSELLIKVKRLIKTLKINGEQLAWLIHNHKITEIDYEEFGLLRWKITKWFKRFELDAFVTYYSKLHEQNSLKKDSSYVGNTSGYKTKEDSKIFKKKTLSDILKELENV